ncbi:hypothetical protein [Rhizobium giardinii]|uniref:SnoaL-like domain-containing protein n=1 Tax=Rhizobium giardinii TaxID=56731 RepID=A0A7W8UGG7_9HYPH|nr:hypothetical protein [Rhizobium giardinii]MBB5538838.1 hypothetical protein [Rhizobium giardinii]
MTPWQAFLNSLDPSDPGDTGTRRVNFSFFNDQRTELMAYDTNPFAPSDQERHAIWEMLVRKDVDGFVNEDWSIFANSFKYDGFCGLDAKASLDPADWEVRFPTVETYRDAWLCDARRAAATEYGEDRRKALFRATNMLDIRVEGHTATARKTFDDAIALADGGSQRLNWQSVFFCTMEDHAWKITGFVGYLPFQQTFGRESG